MDEEHVASEVAGLPLLVDPWKAFRYVGGYDHSSTARLAGLA